MARVLLTATPQRVWRGLNDEDRATLKETLKDLVSTPVPPDAVPISNEKPRFRLQADGFTLGYEYDEQHDLVLIKAILRDAGDRPDVEGLLKVLFDKLN